MHATETEAQEKERTYITVDNKDKDERMKRG
jgi:hypothetical protein